MLDALLAITTMIAIPFGAIALAIAGRFIYQLRMDATAGGVSAESPRPHPHFGGVR
jgi:hypothetical protein